MGLYDHETTRYALELRSGPMTIRGINGTSADVAPGELVQIASLLQEVIRAVDNGAPVQETTFTNGRGAAVTIDPRDLVPLHRDLMRWHRIMIPGAVPDLDVLEWEY